MNLFFTPDHQKNVCPDNGDLAMLNEDSRSWCIANHQNQWMWEVAMGTTPSHGLPAGHSSFRKMVTNIPDQARRADGILDLGLIVA